MKSATILSTALFLGCLVPACATEETGAQSEFQTEGVLGLAPPLAYGETVSGQIAAPQIDVWALVGRAGDKLQLTETVASGDLRPDVVVYKQATEKISSSSYDVTETSIVKNYDLGTNATYYVVVRSYENQGAGSYSLTATCMGGPCTGQDVPLPVAVLGEEEQQECIQAARVCSMAALPAYGGAVGTVRAQQIFDGCLGKSSVFVDSVNGQASCAPACQSEPAGAVCAGIVSLLPWLADQSAECITAFNDCVESCYDAGDGQAEAGVEYGGEAVCVTGEAAFNGSCRDVEQLQPCGGAWAVGSCEACYIDCESTSGAWMDDLDTICSESCSCDPSPDFEH